MSRPLYSIALLVVLVAPATPAPADERIPSTDQIDAIETVEPFGGSPFGYSEPLPVLNGPYRTTRCPTGLCCTPQMIGDFVGFTGSSFAFERNTQNLLGVFTRNLNTTLPFSNNPLVVNGNPVNGTITLDPNINAGTFGTGVQVVAIGAGGFTSPLSVNQVRNLLNGNPNAIVPIVDAGTYNAVAAAQAAQRFGAGGMLVFLPTESGALATNFRQDEVTVATFDTLYTYVYVNQMQVASPSTSGVAVGRQKIAENGSPLPRDRVFVDYGFLNDVGFGPNGLDVNRVVPGFEKTFFGGRCSVEMRMPFASTLDSDIAVGGVTNSSEIELGNLTTYLKVLLAGGGCCDCYAISAGMGFALPTGDDVRMIDGLGRELVTVDNQSFHLLPFVGAVYNPTPRTFMQGFFQLDLDTNGNTVSVHDFQTGGLAYAGRAQDVNYAYFDGSIGYWIYKNRCGNGLVRGIAPMAELHYNLPLQETDVVNFRGFRVGNFDDHAETLNGVIGVNVAMRNNTSLSAGYVAPLLDFDEQYDGAFRMTLNWNFGRR